MKSRSLLLLSSLLGACSVGMSASIDSATPGLPCTQDRDCPADKDMTCVSNLCQAKSTAISNVLIDVELPTSTNLGPYSGLKFILPLDVPQAGTSDITLPALSDLMLDTSFQLIADNRLGCDYLNYGTSRPIDVVVTHRWPVDGLERTRFIASALPATFTAVPSKDDDQGAYKYEVYMALSKSFDESLKNVDESCRLPPVLFRDVKADSQSVTTLNWPSPKSVAIDVQVPTAAVASGSDLQGWQLDVVDPIEARELAIPITLGTATTDPNDASVSHYEATVVYNPIAAVISSPPVGTELLRLQLRSGDARPTYYVALSSLSLFASTGESVVALTAVPDAVTLTGRVETADSGEPVAAKITVLNPKFTVDNNGLWADFRTTTESDATGQFQLALPAGDYRILAVPPTDAQHAVLDGTLSVKSPPVVQGGRLLKIPLLSQVEGSVASPVQWSSSGAANIQAIPTSQLTYDKATTISAIYIGNPAARTASLLLQSTQNSTFGLPTDTGSFDITLQPPDGSPWIVTPGVEVPASSTTLAPWTQPLPVQWSGNLRIPATSSQDDPNLGDVPRAVLRVFVLLVDARYPVNDVAVATSIAQIAEGRSDADGSFNLVLPDKIKPQ
jgi:hypothetical protein